MLCRSLADGNEYTTTDTCPPTNSVGNSSQLFDACYFVGRPSTFRLEAADPYGIQAPRVVGILCLVSFPFVVALGIMLPCWKYTRDRLFFCKWPCLEPRPRQTDLQLPVAQPITRYAGPPTVTVSVSTTGRHRVQVFLNGRQLQVQP
jgi:hypothetical protein